MIVRDPLISRPRMDREIRRIEEGLGHFQLCA
jgi:hypothetical protein